MIAHRLQTVKNADHIIKQINAIHSGGGTALFGGVSQGAAEIRKFNNEKYLNRVFLLSDGQANVGPSTPEDLERLGISLSKENIVVTTIGLGQGYNEDLMTKLALATDSLTYFVENSNDLPRIFNKELGDVMSIVSSDIQIKVELSDGVKLIRTLGRKGSIKGNTLTFDIKHLYNGQDLFTLLEVEVPATQANSTRNLANVTLTYNNLLSQKQERSLDNVSVSFSHSDEEVIASIDKQTQSDVAEYNNAMVLAQNIQYMDQGQREQAMDNIESNIVHLKQQQSTYSNRLLSVQIIELERQRDQLNSGSYDMKMRKSMNQKSFDLWNSRKVKK